MTVPPPWTTRLVAACRAAGVTDPRVLSAMKAVDRRRFVDGVSDRGVGRDRPLRIQEGQTTSQPSLIAQMIQQLHVQPDHHVLEIGTGSGYVTAILALLAGRVTSIERHAVLADQASRRLSDLDTVQVILGDGTKGWPDAAPYDAIIVGAAGHAVPPPLLSQMTDEGCLVMPVHGDDGEWLERHHRVSGVMQPVQRLLRVRFVPLIGDG